MFWQIFLPILGPMPNLWHIGRAWKSTFQISCYNPKPQIFPIYNPTWLLPSHCPSYAGHSHRASPLLSVDWDMKNIPVRLMQQYPFKHLLLLASHTYDLSLPLCLSKSRLPRESKPSPRPMPRPRPPLAPRPPPRPRDGLSPTGLRTTFTTLYDKDNWQSWATSKIKRCLDVAIHHMGFQWIFLAWWLNNCLRITTTATLARPMARV